MDDRAEPDRAQLRAIEDLYDRGLFLQAYRAAEQFAPLERWRDAKAVLLAARLVRHLGGGSRADWLLRRAWRAAPDHPEVRYYRTYYILRRRGPYDAWRWMQQAGDPPAETAADLRSWWCAVRATIAGVLRDFDAAEQWFQRADDVCPGDPWNLVCRASVLEYEDRYEEALAAAQRALEIRPWLFSAVQCSAHLLTLLDRDADALRLLTEASQRVESAPLLADLYGLQLELKRYGEAWAALDRCEALSLLGGNRLRKWLAGQRSEVAYHLGDVPAAIRHGERSDGEFLKAVCQRLKDPERAGRKAVELPVGFVRQHQLTCVPATLSAVSRYWSKPADHLRVAEEICYNGTSAYNERRWAEENGWAVREFTVTEQSAAALLDRGVPFTFTTVDPGSAHLQAVIGYDGRRGTLLIRDPFWRNTGEALTDKLLERYRAYGPRGMALAPVAERVRLDGLDLPQAGLWDRLHALDAALVGHRRDEARGVLAEIEAQGDHSWIVHEARRRLAVYDANPQDLLAAVERLLEVSPDDPCLQLARLSCLRDLARREERLETYARLCAKRDAPAVFLQQYAQELRPDAARHGEAAGLLRRALRLSAREGAHYYMLANLYWDQRRFDEALELYRFAACLDDRDEDFARSYFIAARWFKRTEEALAFLRNRFQRFGRKSGLPARTLFEAYLRLDRVGEALAVVEESLRLRPDDGPLRLFAADAYLACSSENMPRAVELLEQAKAAAPPAEWLRTAARIAAGDGRLEESLRLWQQLLALQPLAFDAHRAVARLLAETQGPREAVTQVATAAAEFPHFQPLQELWIEYLRDEPPEVRQEAIRRLLQNHPQNAWAHRELALVLCSRQQWAEAWAEVGVAERIEPHAPSLYMVRAALFREQGRLPEAKAALRDAVRLSVDNEFAIAELVGLCDTLAERREVLAFVEGELVRQVIFGEGLLAFREMAHGIVAPDELLGLLRRALDARPDLWHAWSACTLQLLGMNRLDKAWEAAKQATDRFPLLPRLWLDRAAVCRAREDFAAEREACEAALLIAPDWGQAVLAMCGHHERRGELAASRQLLERTVARAPLDVPIRVALAETLWRLGQKEAAVEHVQRAVQTDPGYEQAWGDLQQWSDEMERPELALDAARELTVRRAGEARSWLFLARILDAPEQLDERLAALEKAIALNPRCDGAYDLQAVGLFQAGRTEEALAACRPAVYGDFPPVELRARLAWIQAEQGDLTAAIATMRDVVAEAPTFFGAWSRLADWCRQADDKAGYLAAAEGMFRIRPQYEVTLGYLGEARLLNDDRAGAREAYRRAFELAPDYEFAGNALFDLQLEDGVLDAASDTLARLRERSQSAYVLARSVQLAAQRGEEDAAADALRQLCVTDMAGNWPLDAAFEAMPSRWDGLAERIVDQSVAAENVQPEVGRHWVRMKLARKDWSCGRRLRSLCELGDVGRSATYAYLESLAQAKRKLRLWWFLRRNRTWLRQHTFTWGSVLYALATLHQYKAVVRWGRDWRDRTDAEPWMLVNLVEGLWATGRDAEAVEAGRRALEMPASHAADLHRVWLAVDDACAGRIASAQEWIKPVDGARLHADYQFLHTLAECVMQMATAAAKDRKRVFRDVGKRLSQACRSFPNLGREPGRRRMLRRCRKRIARDRGGLAGWWWRVRSGLGML